MEISNALVEAFGREITDLRSDRFRDFLREVPFIEATVEVVDDVRVEVDARGGQSLWTITKQMYLTPRVEFFWPAKWEKTRAELADLLFLLSVYDGKGHPIKQRTILSQAKHAQRDNHFTVPGSESLSTVKHLLPPPYSWDIAPHQYYLLHKLPYFTPTQPNIDKVYNLSATHKSFTTYSFASDFWLPFFDSTNRIADRIDYSPLQTTGMEYERDHHGGGYASIYGYLKQFARGRCGEPFERYSSIFTFYNDLFNSTVSFPGSTSGRTLPDGGAFDTPPEETNHTPMRIIQIVIYNDYLPDLDQFHPDDPLYLG